MLAALPFPADLGALVAPGTLAALTAAEVGAGYLLLSASWCEDDPCTLADDVAVLAMVARLSPASFAEMRPRLWAALCASGCSTAGRVLFERARRVHDELTADRLAAIEQRRRAGRSSARARSGRHAADPPDAASNARSTAVERSLNGRSTAVEIPPGGAAARVSRAPAGAALERSERHLESERSSAADWDHTDARQIVGVIHDGLDAKAEALLTMARVRWSTRLLEVAVDRWRQEGRQIRDAEKGIARIAQHPHALPWAVQLAIARADEARAVQPIGYVMTALGCRAGGRPLEPYIGDQAIVEKWEKIEAKEIDLNRAKAAADRLLTLHRAAAGEAPDRATAAGGGA